MKNKEEKKNRIWVPIVIGALACSAAVGTGIALTHNQQRPKAGTVATMSDAADFSGLTTEVAEVTTEEATTEAVIEAAVSGSEKPEAVPATTLAVERRKLKKLQKNRSQTQQSTQSQAQTIVIIAEVLTADRVQHQSQVTMVALVVTLEVVTQHQVRSHLLQQRQRLLQLSISTITMFG